MTREPRQTCLSPPRHCELIEFGSLSDVNKSRGALLGPGYNLYLTLASAFAHQEASALVRVEGGEVVTGICGDEWAFPPDSSYR